MGKGNINTLMVTESNDVNSEAAKKAFGENNLYFTDAAEAIDVLDKGYDLKMVFTNLLLPRPKDYTDPRLVQMYNKVKGDMIKEYEDYLERKNNRESGGSNIAKISALRDEHSPDQWSQGDEDYYTHLMTSKYAATGIDVAKKAIEKGISTIIFTQIKDDWHYNWAIDAVSKEFGVNSIYGGLDAGKGLAFITSNTLNQSALSSKLNLDDPKQWIQMKDLFNAGLTDVDKGVISFFHGEYKFETFKSIFPMIKY